MEFPLVSIIVPMYNTAGCIARCVKSICAQTYKSIEIILLNDGSTDDTLAVCRALAASDHRIALVDKTNTGAADTRNQGIALAHGKYIQFVDSDDWLAPDFTEKLVSAAEAHTADLVIAPFWMVYPENYVEHIRPWEKALQHVLQRNPPRTRAYGYLPAGVYTGQEYAKHLIQKPNTFYYGSPCNKLYRRDLLRKHSLHFRVCGGSAVQHRISALSAHCRIHPGHRLLLPAEQPERLPLQSDHRRHPFAAAAGDAPVPGHLHRTWHLPGNAGGHPAFALWRKRVHSSAAGYPTDALLQAVTL